MKAIAFITRVHPKRPNMIKNCINSVKTQTSNNYIHILHQHDNTKNGYGLFSANQSLAEIESINALYVMILDDDDILIDPHFVEIFTRIVEKDFPEIVFFKGIVNGLGILPKSNFWQKAPVFCEMASFCFATRLDIWMKYIHKFGKLEHGGDFNFISYCYGKTKQHLWLDRVIAKTQRVSGGKAE